MKRIRRMGPPLLLALIVVSGCARPLAAVQPTPDAVTLKYMHMGVASDGRDHNRYVMQAFPNLVEERYPDIRIKTEMLPEDAYTKSMLMQLSAGEGPDFFEWWPMRQLEELVRAGYLQDLTGMDILDSFSPEALEGFTVNGRVYGLPKGFSMMGAWYNKDMLEQHGYREWPQDWNGFLELCETLKREGVTPIVMPGKDWWFLQFGLYPLAASVVYPEDPDFDKRLLEGTATFAGSKWRDVLHMYKLLYDQGYIAPDSLETGAAQAAAWFNDGRAAIVFGGNWDYDSLTVSDRSSFERDFMPLPGNAPGEPLFLSVGPAGGTVISKNTRNLPETLDALAYQFDPSTPLYEEFKRQYRVFPMFAGEELGIAEFAEYTSLMRNGRSVPFSNQAWPVGVAEALCTGLQDWLAGKGDADAILAAMDRALLRAR
ncbi:ABC transporter substrate-binding protein [Cohnella phaseoli]|uniref:Raffinose/stachyose/melibiose transport system substrate-binding protein n=1 Tax=Cohnella phaseoli TaxID=456490 RepID=A0A3D9I5D8_9BACL|nr:ABC transporter substrate-binding protein [Cohnella phaseoli]RED57013.1 raffinose/stachyose/melibiose transport system substrate-binding protein [Cohnella phaseoli]